MKLNRDIRIDIVKGVCILLMVWGHLPRMGSWAPQLESLVVWIYTFHMSIFVLITGYLFGNKRGEVREFGVVANRLLKPYVFGVAVMLCFYWMAAQLGFETTGVHPLDQPIRVLLSALKGHGFGALWYLYMVCMLEIMTLFSMRITRRNEGANLVWICVVVSVTSIFLRGLGLTTPVEYVPFFLIGFSLRRCNLELPSSWAFLFPALLLLLMTDVCGHTFINAIWVLSLIGTLMWFAGVLDKKAKPIAAAFSFLGRHTLPILMFHNVISGGIRPLSTYILKFEPTGVLLNVVVCALSVLMSLFAEWCINKTPIRKVAWVS